MKVGFIGMGIMGSRMAMNLQRQGYELIVYNRTPDKAQDSIAKGASLANSPAEVAQHAKIIFTMLPHPEAVEAVAIAEGGFLNLCQPDTLWIDCSTTNPNFARRMSQEASQKRVAFIDAPVAGSKNQAEAKELVFLVGADEADLVRCENLLQCMGKKIVLVGKPGMGNALKLVFNLLLGISMVGFAEAMVFGESLGISSKMLLDIVIGSPVVPPYLASKKEKLARSHYDPEFSLKWMQKDLQMVAIAGYQTKIPLPLTNLTKEIYQQAIQQGLAERDFTAIYNFMSQGDRSDKI